MIGLDGKAIFPRSYRREGGICLDIPFYRTGLSECGNLTDDAESTTSLPLFNAVLPGISLPGDSFEQ